MFDCLMEEWKWMSRYRRGVSIGGNSDSGGNAECVCVCVIGVGWEWGRGWGLVPTGDHQLSLWGKRERERAEINSLSMRLLEGPASWV